jgi:hypothetical protein
MEGGRVKHRAIALLVCVVAMGTTGCDQDDGEVSVRGSGNVVSEAREVGSFTEIEIRGSADVVVTVGQAESLLVEAEDNILPLVVTRVVGDRLELETPDEPEVRPTEDIVFTIGVPTLVKVGISGSGNVNVAGVAGDRFEVEISGSGTLQGTGVVGSLTVRVSGSGDFDGTDLRAGSAVVTVSGSGDAVVNVTDTLDATVSGSGDIEYLGDPAVTETISGSGSISPH